MTSGRLLPGLTVRRLLTATPAARPQNKTMSAETADSAGTPQLRQFHMVSIKEFPRGINSDRVISGASATASVQRAPGPGLKLGEMDIASSKRQAWRDGHCQLQASSTKLQAFEPTCSSFKRQASSPKQQASSDKPQAASSLILDPWNMDIGEVLGGKGPRVFTMINVF